MGENNDSNHNQPSDLLVTLLYEHSFSLDNFEPVEINNSKKLYISIIYYNYKKCKIYV